MWYYKLFNRSLNLSLLSTYSLLNLFWGALHNKTIMLRKNGTLPFTTPHVYKTHLWLSYVIFRLILFIVMLETCQPSYTIRSNSPTIIKFSFKASNRWKYAIFFRKNGTHFYFSLFFCATEYHRFCGCLLFLAVFLWSKTSNWVQVT